MTCDSALICEADHCTPLYPSVTQNLLKRSDAGVELGELFGRDLLQVRQRRRRFKLHRLGGVVDAQPVQVPNGNQLRRTGDRGGGHVSATEWPAGVTAGRGARSPGMPICVWLVRVR